MKHVTILLAALVLVLGIHSLGRADAPAGVTRWEYKAIGMQSRLLQAILDPETLNQVKGLKPPSEVELRARYQSSDKDKDGVLSRGDGPDWGGIGADESKRYDLDGDGKVTLEEFVNGMREAIENILMEIDVVRAGKEGWELVSTGIVDRGAILFFRRPLK